MANAHAVTAEDEAHVIAFLHREADLLDDGQYGEWFDLFAADGIYWLPSVPGQSDPLGQASIVYEDRTVLRMRVRRLAHPRAWSLQPLPRAIRQLTNVKVTATDDGYDTVANLQVTHFRDNRTSRYAGRQTMRLRRAKSGLEIVLKRLDLIDCDGVHGVIAVPL